MWLDVKKIIDTLHIQNHKDKRCREPEAVKLENSNTNTMCSEQTFAWLSRYERILNGMTCTLWLLGLAVKVPSLGLSWPILALAAWAGLENATLSPCKGFISGGKGCLGSEGVYRGFQVACPNEHCQVPSPLTTN